MFVFPSKHLNIGHVFMLWFFFCSGSNMNMSGDDWARECALVEEFIIKPGLAKRCELDNFVKR